MYIAWKKKYLTCSDAQWQHHLRKNVGAVADGFAQAIQPTIATSLTREGAGSNSHHRAGGWYLVGGTRLQTPRGIRH